MRKDRIRRSARGILASNLGDRRRPPRRHGLSGSGNSALLPRREEQPLSPGAALTPALAWAGRLRGDLAPPACGRAHWHGPPPSRRRMCVRAGRELSVGHHEPFGCFCRRRSGHMGTTVAHHHRPPAAHSCAIGCLQFSACSWPPTNRSLRLAASYWPRTAGRPLLLLAADRLLPDYCWPRRLTLAACYGLPATGCLLLAASASRLLRVADDWQYSSPTTGIGRQLRAACYWLPTPGRPVLAAYGWPPAPDRLLLLVAYCWPPATGNGLHLQLPTPGRPLLAAHYWPRATRCRRHWPPTPNRLLRLAAPPTAGCLPLSAGRLLMAHATPASGLRARSFRPLSVGFLRVHHRVGPRHTPSDLA